MSEKICTDVCETFHGDNPRFEGKEVEILGIGPVGENSHEWKASEDEEFNPEDSNLYKWAKMELDLAGFSEYSTEPMTKAYRECVLTLMKTFIKQGHSGSSAPNIIEMFKRLASWQVLTPLTLEDNEWGDIFDREHGTRQNCRASNVFKNADGTIHDINVFVKKVVKSKHLGDEVAKDVPEDKQICWHGAIYETKDGVPTNRIFSQVILNGNPDEYMPGTRFEIPCLEVEGPEADWWTMFAEADDITEIEKDGRFKIVWREEAPDIMP